MSSSATVVFEELAGSPKIRLSRGDHSAVRRFVMPWWAIPDFVTNLAVDGTGGAPLPYPALITNSFVADIEIEPFNEDIAPDHNVITNPALSVNTYNRRPGVSGASDLTPRALVTVHYGLDQFNRTWPSNITKPTIKAGTMLRMSVRTSGQFLTLPGRATTLSATSLESTLDQGQGSSSAQGSGSGGSGSTIPGLPDMGLRMLICIQDIKLEWYYVPSTVDISEFDLLIGHVNDSEFVGGAAGTVLFEGYDIDEDHGLDPNNPFLWKISIDLRRRMKLLGTASSVPVWVTWNHDYRESIGGSEGGWVLATMTNGKLRYPLATFSTMFTNALPISP
jgi:hypothetical protein